MILWGKRLFLRMQKLKPDVVYLVLALLFGLVIVFLNPPCGTPDEPAHLLRAFRIAQGSFYQAAAVKVPPLDRYCQLCDDVGFSAIPTHLQPYLKEFLQEGAPARFDEEVASAYPPVPYLPSAIIFKLLSWFNPSLPAYLYLGRLATFLSSLLITWFAIRSIPAGKWIMTVLALMPMRMYQMASISADSVTTALAALWISLVVTLLLSKGEGLGRQLLLLVPTALLLAFSKPMYAFLLLLILAVPFKGYVRYATAVKVAVILIVILAGVKLFSLASHYAVSYGYKGQLVQAIPGHEGTSAAEMISDRSFLEKVDEKAQAALLLREPSRIYSVLIKGYLKFGGFIARSTIDYMGWLNVRLPKLAFACAVALLLLSIGMNENLAMSMRFRMVSLLIFVTMLVLIPIGLYLSWTPVGGDVFLGVGGRYFIPLMPLLFLPLGVSITNRRFHFWAERLVVIGLAGCLLSTLFALWNTYYNNPKTVAVLRLTALSSANAPAILATRTSEGSMKVRGRYNLIASEEPLQYEFRLPTASGAMALLTVTNSPYPIHLKIHSAEIRGLDGNLLKQIDLNSLKRATYSGKKIVSLKEVVTDGEVTLDKQYNSVIFGDLGVVLQKDK
jgi:uncharacterized membrane protein